MCFDAVLKCFRLGGQGPHIIPLHARSPQGELIIFLVNYNMGWPGQSVFPDSSFDRLWGPFMG